MNQFLPKSVRLPFGYTIIIKTIATSSLKKLAGDAFGCWDGDSRTIHIDKTMDEQKQRYSLVHEMQHGFTDWTHKALGEDESKGICRWCQGRGYRND